jgi:hypothetical protein
MLGFNVASVLRFNHRVQHSINQNRAASKHRMEKSAIQFDRLDGARLQNDRPRLPGGGRRFIIVSSRATAVRVLRLVRRFRLPQGSALKCLTASGIFRNLRDVVIESFRDLAPSFVYFLNDWISGSFRHRTRPSCLLGVQMIGNGNPKSSSVRKTRGRIIGLAMCLQFHVNKSLPGLRPHTQYAEHPAMLRRVESPAT